ncbi:Putative SAM-dependent methyltransferase [metagenome]|uniref:SAM-dependent methyltransferase n=1 Tax=metagenome TaxID=256318 RepID=A0A2P2C2F1_9ZZZZ
MSIDTTTTTTSETGDTLVDPSVVEQFVLKVATDLGTAHNSVLVYLGDRLGLWSALATHPGSTSEQLARHTGLTERYLREWLAAQAAAAYVTYEPVSGTFTLPVEHAAVLADPDSPVFMAAGFEVVAAVWATVDQLAHGYATGEGVGWHAHDSRLFTGFERFFRPVYRTSLVSEWLSAVPGLVERLESGIRVLDVGCGLGTATVTMAEAFPASTFVGVDYHDESVRRARVAAGGAGVADRVSFEIGDATSYDGEFDLICLFDTLHDLGDPVGALAHADAHLTEGGWVVAVEPNAGDRLEDNLHPLGLTWYASGHSLCVANSLDQGGEALGAQAGPTRTLRAFADGGFAGAQVYTQTMLNMVVAGQRGA